MTIRLGMLDMAQHSVRENVILTLEGRFDFHGPQIVQSVLRDMVEQSPKTLILHLGGLQFIDSSGMGLL